jgi:transcriptional regulator GlxA family with amidase domain
MQLEGANTRNTLGAKPIQSGQGQTVQFEIFLSLGFCEHETSSITRTLSAANETLGYSLFRTRFVSDTPGFVTSRGGLIVRAAPSIDNHGFSDVTIFVGGNTAAQNIPISRVRQLKKQGLCVVLLSDAATKYIEKTKSNTGAVTTHWKDAAILRESGFHPGLTDRLAEKSDGVITAAGSGSTIELIIGLISTYLDKPQIAQLSNSLLLTTLRKGDAQQPNEFGGNEAIFNQRVLKVILAMEENISEPISMQEMTKIVGMSTRQIERVFQDTFDQSPGKFYRLIRAKKARALIEETLIPLVEIAVATGYGSVSTMARTIRAEYGETPAQLRTRKNKDLMKFSKG